MVALSHDSGNDTPAIYGYGRSRVAKCSVHLAIAEEAERRLALNACFAMPAIIKALGYQTVAKSIRWPSLVALIEDRHQCGLVPVTVAYFNRAERYEYLIDENGQRTPTDRAILNPEKFLAGGPNKPTHGYVLTGGDDPGRRAIVLESFKRLVAQKGGTDDAVVARRQLLESTGLLGGTASDDLLSAGSSMAN